MVDDSKDHGKIDRHKTPSTEKRKATLRPEEGNAIFCARSFRTTSVLLICKSAKFKYNRSPPPLPLKTWIFLYCYHLVKLFTYEKNLLLIT
ncbi:hypothetical protein SAMN05421636_11247 [Pricia antarctica]|uniref:Uncharacterized protein n=1 Tax=Pricia antarctica TaxID=641691 RepID=A0A1G7IIU7_9FLAO|nr:hypothetical protein SAMN05421636_11247 [Pricia antarctica]